MLPRRACHPAQGARSRILSLSLSFSHCLLRRVGSGLSWNSWALGTCLAAYCCVGTQYCCTGWVQTWHEY